MYKRVYGFCPTQNKDYSIRVNYINASTTERFEYAKGLAVAMIVTYLNVLLLQMLLKAFRAKTVG
jgi:hypothetical protein